MLFTNLLKYYSLNSFHFFFPAGNQEPCPAFRHEPGHTPVGRDNSPLHFLQLVSWRYSILSIYPVFYSASKILSTFYFQGIMLGFLKNQKLLDWEKLSVMKFKSPTSLLMQDSLLKHP